MSKVCPKCNAILDDSKKFCNKCGTNLQNAYGRNQVTPETIVSEEISIIKNKVVWNVPIGEIAYRISEKEMDSMMNVAGIVVDEGISANIYVDGKLAAEIHGGNYDFISQDDLDFKLKARYGGIVGGFSNAWKFLARLWMGTTLKDKIDNNEGINKIESVDDLVASLRGNSVYSVILKVDKEFPLYFEEQIATEQYSGTIGLGISAQVTNFKQFIQYFTLSEANRNVTNSHIRDLFKNAVMESLRNETFTNGQVDNETIQRILSRLQLHVNNMNTGISVVRINDCSVNSQDLNRLRDLSREIYLSNQEIDRLHNMNIIKNRLTSEANQQRITEAQSERDLARVLQDINKDNILREDDMVAFLETIQSTKILRTARSQEELDQAISEIKKAKLLRETDINLLIMEAKEKLYKRETAFSLMQLHDSIERDGIEQKARHDSEVKDVQHLIGLERLKDAYSDERFMKGLQLQKEKFWAGLEARKQSHEQDVKEKLDNIRVMDVEQDVLEKIKAADHARQMERFNALNAQELNRDNMRYGHEENMSRINIEKTAEQIEAEQIARLSPEAQIAYFNSKRNEEAALAKANAEKEKNDFMKEIFQNQREDSNMDKDRMERLAMKAFDVAAGTTSRERDRGDEYKANLYRTQDRFDRQQEQLIQRALGNNESKNPTASPQPNVGPVVQPQITPAAPSASAKGAGSTTVVVCAKCGTSNDLSEGRFCGSCGEPLVNE